MIEIWPFPILRNEATSPAVTRLFLMFARSSELRVADFSAYEAVVECEFGRLRFWNANAYYAWASSGSFTRSDGLLMSWRGVMPSRFAVRAMRKAMDRKLLALVVAGITR